MSGLAADGSQRAEPQRHQGERAGFRDGARLNLNPPPVVKSKGSPIAAKTAVSPKPVLAVAK